MTKTPSPRTNLDRVIRLAFVAQLVPYLNDLLARDRDAVRALFACEVPTKKLGSHPTVQVGQSLADPNQKGDFLRVLGLLNGFLGCDEQGKGFLWMAVHDHTGQVLRFQPSPRCTELMRELVEEAASHG